MSSDPSVAVLGAGAGGLATAADLTLAGLRVHLYELPEFAATLDAIRAQRGIEVSGARTGRASPELVTSDAARALEDAELLLVAAPAYGHRRMLDAVLPYLRSGQFLLFSTGYWAALRFRAAVASDSATLAESTLLVYAARRTGPAAVHIDGIKGDLPVAALPAHRTSALVELVRRAYPQARAMRNVLEVSLEDLNPLFHPAISLLNAGELDRATADIAFYSAGCTPAVGRVIDAVDRERREVGAALGLTDLVSAATWLHRYYGASGTTAYEAIGSCPAYRDFRWPASTARRYVDEDVPYAFVPLAAIAEQLGVPTPVTRALVDLCGVAFGRDYWAEGPGADELRIRGMRAADLTAVAERGDRPTVGPRA